MDTFGCFSFCIVNNLGVDLSCADILMSKHLAHRIDVGAIVQQQGSVGVAEAVESYVLLNSGSLDPVIQLLLYESVCETLEDSAPLPLGPQSK